MTKELSVSAALYCVEDHACDGTFRTCFDCAALDDEPHGRTCRVPNLIAAVRAETLASCAQCGRQNSENSAHDHAVNPDDYHVFITCKDLITRWTIIYNNMEISLLNEQSANKRAEAAEAHLAVTYTEMEAWRNDAKTAEVRAARLITELIRIRDMSSVPHDPDEPPCLSESYAACSHCIAAAALAAEGEGE